MKNKSSLIVLLIGAIMFGTFALMDKEMPSVKKLKPDKVELEKNEKQVSRVNENYLRANTLLKAHSDSLQKELKQTQFKLKAAKFKLNESQTSVLALAEKDTVGLSVTQRLNDCDSLKEQVIEFAGLVDSTNNLHQRNISQLQNLVATKDTEIVVCRSSYAQLKSITDENLTRERKLAEELQIAYKQQRKKVVQHKVLAAGFLILSGITTSLYINSKR